MARKNNLQASASKRPSSAVKRPSSATKRLKIAAGKRGDSVENRNQYGNEEADKMATSNTLMKIKKEQKEMPPYEGAPTSTGKTFKVASENVGKKIDFTAIKKSLQNGTNAPIKLKPGAGKKMLIKAGNIKFTKTEEKNP